MAQRHKARQYALQMLFQWEIGRQEPLRIEDGFWRIARAEKNTRVFANDLFEGVVRNSAELDALVSAHTDNWRLERLALIDRAILRLGVHELRSGKTPRKVVVNEAVELAKTFSSEDAAGFVNGVLDSVLHSLPEKKENETADRKKKPAASTPSH
jgi:N utilization substance protein B